MNQDCLIGITCNDFVLVAADTANIRNIVVTKDDENKIHKLGDKLVMAISGQAGDTTQFESYVEKNIQLYKMRNRYQLSPAAAANFTRRGVADSLRSGKPFFVNLLLAGFDDETGPELYFIDCLGAMAKMPYAAHGHGGLFSLSIMDRYHKAEMTETEAYELMKKSVEEVQKRFSLNLPNFKVQIVDKNGIRDLPLITYQVKLPGSAQAGAV